MDFVSSLLRRLRFQCDASSSGLSFTGIHRKGIDDDLFVELPADEMIIIVVLFQVVVPTHQPICVIESSFCVERIAREFMLQRSSFCLFLSQPAVAGVFGGRVE